MSKKDSLNRNLDKDLKEYISNLRRQIAVKEASCFGYDDPEQGACAEHEVYVLKEIADELEKLLKE